jgi:hypothetical protein
MARKNKNVNASTAVNRGGAGGAANGKSKRGRRSRRGNGSLEQQYTALLKDPCSGPLTYPQYGDSSSGYLARFSQVLNFGSTSSWAVYYHPSDNYIHLGTSLGPATDWTATTNAQVGSTFLTALVGNFRPVAACMEYQYTGLESSRAGLMCFSNKVPHSMKPTATTNGNDLFAAVPNTTRTPPTKLTLNFLPDEQASMYRIVGGAATEGEYARMQNGLCIGMQSGGTTADAHRVKITVVYEWTPKVDSGVATAGKVPRPTIPYNKIVESLASSAMVYLGMGGGNANSTIRSQVANLGTMALDYFSEL